MATGRPSVLVVENDPVMSDLLQNILRRQGWQTHTALDGEQALSLAAVNHPDVVILDYVLPKLSGVEVCRRLSADHSVPVIMLGERDYTHAKLLSIKAGARCYVGKPFEVTELVTEVKTALGQKA